MAAYAHGHPLPDGSHFEHAHQAPATIEAADEHARLTLAEAHPELARVERLPPPGSPADYRHRAGERRGLAAWHRAEAARLDQEAARLDEQAAADEQRPPTPAERIRRQLDGRA